MKHLASGNTIKSTELAQAIFYSGINGSSMEILKNRDIIFQASGDTGCTPVKKIPLN